MTDDEAFIRVILDSPGDEAPRLVYADWLEERGDPRSAYLRAEREAVKTGDTSELAKLAVGLDPVWVARVTLPPLGVCCEHIQIRDRGPVITAKEIEQFELKCGIRLPHDYRAFLLNYNGGVVSENESLTPDGEPYTWGEEHTFYSLESRSDACGDRGLERWAAFRHEYIARFPPDPTIEQWFMRFIPVGRSADPIFGLLLGVAEPEFGKVRYFDFSVGFYPGYLDRNPEPDATSFAEYLSTLPRTGYP
jgi:uncharacterized protein (TIGR02996 family)